MDRSVGGGRADKASAIKPVFATLEKAMIIRHLGIISNSDKAALKSAIAQTLT